LSKVNKDTVNPKVAMMVGKQLAECMKKSPDGTRNSYLGVRVVMNEANLLDVQADILGPVNTPYEGGIFRCKLTL
jgi:ubiquitin-conjugating enzyme E2 S